MRGASGALLGVVTMFGTVTMRGTAPISVMIDGGPIEVRRGRLYRYHPPPGTAGAGGFGISLGVASSARIDGGLRAGRPGVHLGADRGLSRGA